MSSKTLYKPTRLPDVIHLPASKSISNRALIISALAQRNIGSEGPECRLDNISDCDDSKVVVRALAQNKNNVASEGAPPVVDIMAAGTAMRFLTAYFAVNEGTYILTGTERMRHRPIAILVDALRSMGANIEYECEEGFPPLRIKGGSLQGGEVRISGQVSSQYVSALMMIGPTMRDGLKLCLEGNIVSRPYIDMTISLMRAFGADVEWADERTVRVSPKPYKPTSYGVESDWSAASYWYELIALTGGELFMPRLYRNSVQGDSKVREFFEPLGVKTVFTAEGARICKENCDVSKQETLALNLVEQPDLAQTLVCTCAFMGKAFYFTGLQSLKIKETDRIKALRTELYKLGYNVQEKDDSVLSWDPSQDDAYKKNAESPAIDTYDDHRMAMSFAYACVPFGKITINNPEVVSKSYPTFWDEFPQDEK
ncbi:MAG: 3-phosphoshikimate 1-carboxyvinyltransferase [Bacteroidaceae bacterium]|nr:3-phosphoshikimate 1-carboxyvinyltransferase [Bacteroidaceae bacterium]